MKAGDKTGNTKYIKIECTSKIKITIKIPFCIGKTREQLPNKQMAITESKPNAPC